MTRPQFGRGERVIQAENPNAARGFSLKAVLLIALAVAIGVGATVYAITGIFAARGASNAAVNAMQSTSTTNTTGHNCTRTSG